MIVDDGRSATAIHVISTATLATWRQSQDHRTRAWLDASDFKAEANEVVRLADADGSPGRLIAGIGAGATLESLGELAAKLPAGDYRLLGVEDARVTDDEAYRLALGWGLGAYRYAGYKSEPEGEAARLLVADARVLDELAAVSLCRDLVNTPAADLLPHHLEAAARQLASRYGATVATTTGDELLRRGMNAIHAVGAASASAPRLIDLRWGDGAAPKVTLVGKGVCFDSGGLDLKSSGNMRLMKKDMGGAAHVLGLASLSMARRLPIALRVLVPAVENAVSANAYRPGDVIRTYQGTTVEIENTDAEGRLVLADALALALEDEPQLLIDFATLTGAARVALGTDLPAFFANDDAVATDVQRAGEAVEDPVWRLPLFEPYRSLLASETADLANAPSSPYAGAIAAALFLQHFVGSSPWLHFDIMAWNMQARPAHPIGGEAMGLRATYRYLAERFGG